MARSPSTSSTSLDCVTAATHDLRIVTPPTALFGDKLSMITGVTRQSVSGRDGYNAVQLGFVEDKPIRLKNVTKPLQGHFEKSGVPPTRVLKEIRLTAEPEAAIGDQVKVDAKKP